MGIATVEAAIYHHTVQAHSTFGLEAVVKENTSLNPQSIGRKSCSPFVQEFTVRTPEVPADLSAWQADFAFGPEPTAKEDASTHMQPVSGEGYGTLIDELGTRTIEVSPDRGPRQTDLAFGLEAVVEKKASAHIQRVAPYRASVGTGHIQSCYFRIGENDTLCEFTSFEMQRK
jgi:hypothetical protein